MPEFNCFDCERPDDEDNMVQCDNCTKWFHFSCAGVEDTLNINNQEWKCKHCNVPNDEISIVNTSLSHRSTHLDLELKKLEEENELQKQYIKRKYEILNSKLAESGNNTSVKSKHSQRSSMSKVNDWLAKDQTTEVSFRNKDATTSASVLHPATSPKIKFISAAANTEILGENNENMNIDADVIHMPRRLERKSHQGTSNFNVKEENANLLNIPKNVGFNFGKKLQNEQLLARQVIPKELPYFSGNPEDWPMFISNFNHSTTVCGYSNDENLIRLQRCIKGDALEAVRSRLLLPSSVPSVISTLQLLYGRPEILIHSLLNKIRNTPTPKMDKLESLIKYGLAVQNLCDHLEAAGQQKHLSNPLLLQELVEKLPSNIKLEWAMYKRSYEDVTLLTLGKYMSQIVLAASEVVSFVDYGASKEKPWKQKEKNYLNYHNRTKENKVSEPKKKSCLVCQQTDHKLKECENFKKFSIEERWKIVQNNHICRCCLNYHGRWPCKFSKPCEINGCQTKHHPLLHSIQLKDGKTESSISEKLIHGFNAFHNSNSTTLFRILPVTLYGKNKSIDTYAFLDDGSSLTLIEDNLATELGIKGQIDPLCLKWTNNVTRTEPNSRRIQLEISGRGKNSRFLLDNIRTVSCQDLPTQTLKFSELETELIHLKGLPIQSYNKAVPKILIGLDNSKLISSLKIREGNLYEPIASKTRLGWCIYGNYQLNENNKNNYSCHICDCSSDNSLHDTVKEYFTIENTSITNKILMESEEDKRARKILETTTIRVKNGFETGLLWKYDYIEFPESYQMALSRLKCLERKLQADPKLYTKINNQIKEYQIKEYAHKATENELKLADPRRVWYLPLGIVINPKKPNKVRLIWDAAAQVDGISFNSMLLKGPDQLNSLATVLCRFRQRQVAICGDIREMFHQIKIRDEDKQSQRFLWREDSSKEPEVYIMDVATFGSTCSPCSAQYVKNLNAKENVLEYPKAASVILENHYVDDYLDSLNTVEETIKLAEEVKIVHKKGGFEIRNWLSNSTEVLQKIGETDLSNIKKFNDKQTERVLGMIWLPESDVFIFSTMIKEEIHPFMYGDVKPTKRQILKCVMSMFDPLGLLTFYTIHGKILIQDIWRTSIKWDDEIPQNLYERWSRWSKLFSQIHDIQIPRCYFDGCSTDCFKSVQLHVFVDASESAYACIAYFRIIDNGKPRCVLVSAKAKVAPLKPISIPRLELQAAVIGTRLMKTICSNHNYKITKRFLYTDSSTVLQWIRSDARKYRQFVALRIGEILTETDINEWNWVPTKINVADEATKWGKGPCFEPNCRWFNGPEFLYQAEENWPKQNISFDNTKELRVSNFHQEVKNEKIIEFDNFSKWERLVRTTCYIFRFIESCRAKSNKSKNTDCMKQEELTKSENILFRMAQNEVYQEEMLILNENKSHQRKILDKTSTIYKLSPFIDEFGVLRIEGRIDTAPNVSYEAKYPIILPKRHKITALLVNWYHRKFYHCNHETVVNEVRQKFYISNLRTIVKNVIRQCQWCINYKAHPTTPRMAPLPKSRLMSFVRPFTYVGLDYFGPILIKIKRSNDKRWIAIFTCLTIRAIHMEVVNSLSTEACIMAIRRFVARRGPPLEIYTDNGTNFQGASKQLNAELKEINKSISETFTSSHTKWIFNPPAAPHMGGAWERMVRSVKVAMKTMVTKKTLDEETLKTIITEAESLINSRPLTYIPIEPDNQEALTPNHFLLGSSNGIRQHIEKDVTKNYNLRSSWHFIQDSIDQFWNRWIKEYLPMITRRTKWLTDTKLIETGDIVLIVDCKIKNQWTRERVVRVIEGQNGRIRQAIVKVGNKFLRRPTTKLAVLDLQDNSKTEFKNQSYEGKNVTADSFGN